MSDGTVLRGQYDRLKAEKEAIDRAFVSWREAAYERFEKTESERTVLAARLAEVEDEAARLAEGWTEANESEKELEAERDRLVQELEAAVKALVNLEWAVAPHYPTINDERVHVQMDKAREFLARFPVKEGDA